MKTKEKAKLVKKAFEDINDTFENISKYENFSKKKGKEFKASIIALIFSSIDSLIDLGVLELK